MEDMEKFLLIMIGIMIFLSPVLVLGGNYNSRKNYKENYLEEDKTLFVEYNQEYEDQTNENSRKIILEVKEKDADNANKAIVNYVSNVGGRLVSINNIVIPKNIFRSVVTMNISSSGSMVPGVGAVSSTKISNKNQYVLAVPNNAKLADDLQERLNQYLKYGNYNYDQKRGE